LIAVAGLDHEPPDFLLGALVSMAHERDRLTFEQRARVASLGRDKLDERATAKRAWKSWRRSQDLHSFMLNSAQLRRLIEALGGKAPEDSKVLVAALTGLLRGVGDAAVEIAAREDEPGLRLRPLKPGQGRGPRRLVPWWVRAERRVNASRVTRRLAKSSRNGGGRRKLRSAPRPYGRRSVVKVSFRRSARKGG
jgi:hypothetical protein